MPRRLSRTPKGVEAAAGRQRHRAAWDGALAPNSSPHTAGRAGREQRAIVRHRRTNQLAAASRRRNRAGR